MAHSILVLTDHRYRAQLQPTGVVAALRRHGAHVVVYDETELDSPGFRAAADRAAIVVARCRHPRLLRALAELERSGTPVLDSAHAVEQVRDKRIMSRMLAAAGVATPRTIVGTLADVRAGDLVFPIICKPVFGDNSEGLIIVPDAPALVALTWPEVELIAQEYRPGSGADMKLYVVDGIVTAIRKPSPITACRTSHLGLTAPTTSLIALARRCGDLFGLSMFGVDCLELHGQLVVVEVNDFPNYTEVPFASELLALHTLRTLDLAAVAA